MKFKDRIKNYGFWTSLSAAVVLFVQTLGEIFGFGVRSEAVSGIIMAVCGILIVLGIVSNPTDGKWFADSKQSEQPQETSNDNESENPISK